MKNGKIFLGIAISSLTLMYVRTVLWLNSVPLIPFCLDMKLLENRNRFKPLTVTLMSKAFNLALSIDYQTNISRSYVNNCIT